MTGQILLVDDNEITRKLVRLVLDAEGFEVYEATCGAHAVELAKSKEPHLVLQDLVLPDVDGFTLLDQLRICLGPRVPILAFTGLLSATDEKRLGLSSFDDVITKPIEPSRLREMIRAYFPGPSDTDVTAFGTGKHLLLVDDDATQRKLAAFRLSRLGFQVTMAGDGEEALALARASRPDVIVSDVLMPGIDGFELCSRVRVDADLKSTPILLMTNSYLEVSDRELAERAGADAYVLRTPELIELTAVLRPLMNNARSKRASILESETREDIARDHTARAMRQLDRQVALNALLTQRSAMLSAELTILSGLTGALAEHRDIDMALDTALHACFDAGGLAWGMLLVRVEDGWTKRSIGLSNEPLARLEAIDGLAEQWRHEQRDRGPTRITINVFEDCDECTSPHVLLAPVLHRDELLGFLLLGAGAEIDDHRMAFAGVVTGQIAHMLALARAFRELEEASQIERARARLLSSILDAIEDPIVVFDQNHQPSHWNRAAERVGLTERPASPADWPRALGFYEVDQTTLFPWEKLPAILALRGEKVIDTEIFWWRSGDSARWLSAHAQAVMGENGETEAAVSILRDITADKLAQAKQIVADRMASIGVLAAGVAHEVNNPLTAIIAEVEMALEDIGRTHPAADGLSVARDAAERVRTIVRDLTTFSRGDSDDLTPVDICRALDASIRMAVPATRSRATVHRDYQDVSLVLANESRLGQVFLNLLVNAAHAIPVGSPDPHRIDVRVRTPTKGGVLIEISDTGIGMTREIKERLFTPFFTTKESGTGLGLAISHRIITNAGGTIEVDSTPGLGTTFRIWLPPSRMTRRASTLPPSVHAPDGAHVLAIDDDPLVLQVIARTLRGDHHVDTERSPSAALVRLASGKNYDLILCDLSISEISAPEFRHRLLAIRPELADRLVFVSSGSARAENHAFLDAHGVPCLDKPFDAQTLRALIEQRSL